MSKLDPYMTHADLTVAAELLHSRINWAELPKLAAMFEHRPRCNVYWHELVIFMLANLGDGPAREKVLRR